MTASEFANLIAARKARALPMSFAILRDGSRRGGVRVSRVRVCASWAELDAAGVEEMRSNVAHVLPFCRLRKNARAAGAVVRASIEFRAVAEEAQSAAGKVAGKVAAA